MIGRIQPSKTSASCMLWQSTSNEEYPEDYVILQELPSTFRKVNEHLLKLNWLHIVLCCQECFLLSRLLVLALSSLPVRPVDNCWAGKVFIWIIKSRTWLLFVLGSWEPQFGLKHLVLEHPITESLLGDNLTSDSSLQSGCGFWSCSALEASHWCVDPAGFYTWTLLHVVLPISSSVLQEKPQAMGIGSKMHRADEIWDGAY